MRGSLGEQRQLVAAFAECDKQRQERGADEQPVADRYEDRGGAGCGAQREAGRDGEHVENDDVLEERRIRRQQSEIRGGGGEERKAERERSDECCDAEDDRGRQRDFRAELAGRDWPFGLQRMALILFAIEDIVDEIHRSRERAENKEGGDRAGYGICVGETLREDHGREDEKVLRPLAWA